MASYFRSEINEKRTRYELNIIKLVKSYEYFVGEIKKLSDKIIQAHSFGESYDNNIQSLYNNMKGLVDSVNLYGRRVGVISKIYVNNKIPLSEQVNAILCSGNINDFVKKYSEIINSDKFLPMKRRKIFVSRSFNSRLKEHIDNIDVPITSKGFVERLKASIGCTVEDLYGVNIFDIPTCGVMQNEEKYIKIKSPLPILIEREFERLGLPSGTKQKSKAFGDQKLIVGQNTSVLGARVYGSRHINQKPSGRSILAERVYGSDTSGRTNGR